MKLKITRKKMDDSTLQYRLAGEMTVYSSVKLKDVLTADLKSCPGIALDLAEVDEADTAGFQLILFLRREAEALGKTFRITGASQRIRSIFTLYRESL